MKYHKGNPFAICFLIFFGTKKSVQITPLLSVCSYFLLFDLSERIFSASQKKQAYMFHVKHIGLPLSVHVCSNQKIFFLLSFFFLLYILQWFHFKHIRILLYHFFHFVHFTFAFIAVSIH